MSFFLFISILMSKFDERLCFTRLVKHNIIINMGEPYIKHIEENIWELRPLRDRIFFTYFDNNTFILLNIFMKQTNKTPRREIDEAKRKLQDFINRSGIDGK